jgi:hypothetical protein
MCIPPSSHGLQGCPSFEEGKLSSQGQPTVNSYRWQVFDPSAPGGSATYDLRSCRLRHVFQAQGAYQVELTITNPDGTPFEGRAEPYRQEVVVRDYLIVSLGDSYASGEGNPDVPQVVDDSRTTNPLKRVVKPPRWQDERCHRSSWAGPAQAALAIERADPHSSVTFLSFACSNATIDTPSFGGGNPLDPYAPADERKPTGTGILGPYRGVEPPNGEDPAPEQWNDHLPSQMDQLTDAVTTPGGQRRHIDALTISGGGNDIGFGRIAQVCVLYGDCPNHPVGSDLDWFKLMAGAVFEPGVPLRERFAQDLAALPDKYSRLNAALRDPSRGLDIG